MLRDEIWFSVADSARGMLCITCIESRLGRRLTPMDFNLCYLNDPKFGCKSIRLLSRLRAEIVSKYQLGYQMTEQNSIVQVLCDPLGRRMMITQLLLCKAGHKNWTPDQIERLTATIDSVADAFGVDAEKMLLRIGEME